MTPALAALSGFAIVACTLAVVWAVQLKTRNAGMVDPVWSWSMGFLAVWYAIFGTADFETRLALGLLGGLWGFRLGTHLYIRNAGKPEDARYAKFRAEWGQKANSNMFWFFQFQNLFTLMLSASAFLPLAFRQGVPPFACLILAVLIWIASVLGEGIADRATLAIGALEILLGLWAFSGRYRRMCALVQTLAIASMNTLEIYLAPDLLISALGMVALNLAFLSLIWYWAVCDQRMR